MSVNTCQLIGHLGADPDLRYTGTGTAVCEMRLATTEQWKDRDGKKQEKTSWHRIIVWTGAENCAKYLRKGRQIFVAGRIQYREYEKDGVKKYITEIVAHDVQFLSSGKGDKREDSDGPPPPAPPSGSADEDSIPF
jgi:single-strand DNA-binding protein